MTTDSLRKQVVEAMAQALHVEDFRSSSAPMPNRETIAENWRHVGPLSKASYKREASAALDAALEVLGEQVADWHEAADLLNGDSDCDSLPADLLAVLRARKGSE